MHAPEHEVALSTARRDRCLLPDRADFRSAPHQAPNSDVNLCCGGQATAVPHIRPASRTRQLYCALTKLATERLRLPQIVGRPARRCYSLISVWSRCMSPHTYSIVQYQTNYHNSLSVKPGLPTPTVCQEPKTFLF